MGRTEGMIGIIYGWGVGIYSIYICFPPSPHTHFKLGCAPLGALVIALLLPTGELSVVPAPFLISGEYDLGLLS